MIGRKVSKTFAIKGHPRGMLGKHHKKSVVKLIGRQSKLRWLKMSVGEKSAMATKMMKRKIEKYGTLCRQRPETTWKAGWRVIGGQRKYYRSRWEANYARVLEFQKQRGLIVSWAHEPKTFWFEKIKRGCRSYLPDFEVVYPDGHIEYHEVKGWYDDRSKTKTKRMAKYYPEVKLRMIFGKDYNTLKRQLAPFIHDWE